MNKNLIAAAVAATMSTASFAAANISGNYEGTVTDGNPGASTFAQDLDLTIKGSVDGTSITATIEDLSGGDTVTTNELYVETSIEGLGFKGGKSKGQNGAGLLQKKSSATNKIKLSTDVAGFGIAVSQASGDANATADVSASIAGVDVVVQNLTNDSRFITASTSVAGLDLNLETQEYSTGKTNTGMTASTAVALSESTSVGVAGVYIDVEDTAGVTQDDGILGDISDANSNSEIKAGVVTLGTDLGDVTGKLINKNDKDTYVAELERGIWTFGYSKTEDTDAVATAKIEVSF